MPPLVSVLMPTHNQARFIRRALDGLRAQTLDDWELIVVDDGSTDGTGAVLAPFLNDCRVRYRRFEENRGLGAALNAAMEAASGRLIAYLPSDDVYYPDHLASLAGLLGRCSTAALAYSGIRHHYNRTAPGRLDGYPLQLVQVMHRRTDARWTEREEMVTDDLGRMFWEKLRPAGTFEGTRRVTCEWVDHPHQLHKVVQEPVGGINTYRDRFRVGQPLRFHTTVGNLIDEVALYRRYRERPPAPPATDGLRILLVGELAYNADRILALEEQGHTLFGLWMPEPYWYNTVGPLPFGHVQDLPRAGWQEAVRRVQPDVIYALLNWQAVPFAHHVLTENPGVPFVWHFKEGPFICLEKGTWNQLVDLVTRSDGQIYSSPEMRDWLETVVPGCADGRTLVLDGDLPKRDWLDAAPSPRLSGSDGQLHTVVPGRPIGLHPQDVGALGRAGIHLHFYGDFTQGQWRAWIEKALPLAPGTLHLHPTVDQDRWVTEFSRYDAGWLHYFRSENEGDLRRANWDDLNYPARMATLAAAGLPLLQYDNRDAAVAVDRLARTHDLGLFFTDFDALAEQLRDQQRMAVIRASVWRAREQFTFDHHAARLTAFFRDVIAARG